MLDIFSKTLKKVELREEPGLYVNDVLIEADGEIVVSINYEVYDFTTIEELLKKLDKVKISGIIPCREGFTFNVESQDFHLVCKDVEVGTLGLDIEAFYKYFGSVPFDDNTIEFEIDEFDDGELDVIVHVFLGRNSPSASKTVIIDENSYLDKFKKLLEVKLEGKPVEIPCTFGDVIRSCVTTI